MNDHYKILVVKDDADLAKIEEILWVMYEAY